MSDAQLLEYINQQLHNGAPKDQIKSSLVAGGWKTTDVDEALTKITTFDPSVPLPPAATRPLPGIREILRQSFDIYKQRFATFAGIMAIPALLSVITIFSDAILKQLLPGSPLAADGIKFLCDLVFLVGEALGGVALLYAIKDHEEKIGVKVAYARAWNKVLSYIWISILVTLIIAGGFILLIVPGVIFSIWFGMAIYILVNENTKGMDAVLRSKSYAQGKWLDLFIRYLVLGLLVIAIFIVEHIIFGFLPTAYGLGAQNIINITFIAPFSSAYLFLTYFHLKASKGEAAVVAVRSKKTGFIVIGIIGLLFVPIVMAAIIALGSAKKTTPNPPASSYAPAPFDLGSFGLESAKIKARDTKRLADIKQLSTSVEMYRADNDKLPPDLDALYPKYNMFKLADPSTQLPYVYTVLPNGTDYTICADMETTGKQQCMSSMP